VIHYQDRWAVVTGASSGLGRGLAAGLADRGMSLVLTGRDEAGLEETVHQIRRAAPGVKVETVAADLSSRSGMSALLATSATARSRYWSTTPGSAPTAHLPRPTRAGRPTRWPSTSVS
jgi:short-subunit dehydrogenase